MKFLIPLTLLLTGCQVSYQKETPSITISLDDSVEQVIHNHYTFIDSLEKNGWLDPDKEYP